MFKKESKFSNQLLKWLKIDRTFKICSTVYVIKDRAIAMYFKCFVFSFRFEKKTFIDKYEAAT